MRAAVAGRRATPLCAHMPGTASVHTGMSSNLIVKKVKCIKSKVLCFQFMSQYHTQTVPGCPSVAWSFILASDCHTSTFPGWGLCQPPGGPPTLPTSEENTARCGVHPHCPSRSHRKEHVGTALTTSRLSRWAQLPPLFDKDFVGSLNVPGGCRMLGMQERGRAGLAPWQSSHARRGERQQGSVRPEP